MKRLQLKRTHVAIFMAILTTVYLSLAFRVPIDTRPGLPGCTLDGSAAPARSPVLQGAECTPATGDENTVFTFRVEYRDADNDAPTTITTTIAGGTPITMNPEDPTNTVYTSFSWYAYSTKLSPGNYTFSMYCSSGIGTGVRNATVATRQGPVVTLSPAGKAAEDTQAATTAGVAVGCVAGGVLAFAALVVYRDRLPAKMQRVIPEKAVFSRAGRSIKGGLGTAGEKTKNGLVTAGRKTRSFFSNLASKIRHH